MINGKQTQYQLYMGIWPRDIPLSLIHLSLHEEGMSLISFIQIKLEIST